MKMHLKPALISIAIACFAISSPAIASATYCSDTHPTLSIADAKWDGVASSDCYGLSSGTLNYSQNPILSFSKWGDDFDYLLKDDNDGDSGTIEGVKFSLDAELDQELGNWVLDWENLDDNNPGLPLTLDFVLNLKSANSYASFLFKGIDFTSDPQTGTGSFKIAADQDLSNMSLYVRGGSSTVTVPEPGTLALFGLGLTGLVVARRRQKA